MVINVKYSIKLELEAIQSGLMCVRGLDRSKVDPLHEYSKGEPKRGLFEEICLSKFFFNKNVAMHMCVFKF